VLLRALSGEAGNTGRGRKGLKKVEADEKLGVVVV
jgi:hypothetical protein